MITLVTLKVTLTGEVECNDEAAALDALQRELRSFEFWSAGGDCNVLHSVQAEVTGRTDDDA